MKALLFYMRLLGWQLRASVLLTMQYRFDFFLDGLVEIFWTITALVPLFVIFHSRNQIASWSFGQSLLVTGWFTLLQGLLEGAINPSLANVVEHIRKGTLDFVLLKPADAQFLVSTARFEPWRAVNVITALGIFLYAFHTLGKAPSMLAILLSLLLLLTSITILYSLWLFSISAAFYVVRVDNLTYLFGSIFDAARWPSSVFRGLLHVVFTFVIPLAMMTTYPAQALLGTLSLRSVAAAIAGATMFALFSRSVWLCSIRKYTSASSLSLLLYRALAALPAVF